MKKYMVKGSLFCYFLGMLLVVTSCKKDRVSQPDRPPLLAVIDSLHDLPHLLDSGGFRLFSMALHHCGLDTVLSYKNKFTVFAPTDNAMTAAGFTASIIEAYNPDSLAGIMRYHLVYGAYSDTSFFNSPAHLTAQTLSVRPIFIPIYGFQNFPNYLYLQPEGDSLLINTKKVSGPYRITRASNGNIFSIDCFLHPLTSTVYDVIRSRPELSLYFAAMQISDSVLTSIQGTPPQDSVAFNSLLDPYLSPVSVTVFAPVNEAFNRFGLYTTDDIRNYIQNNVAYLPGGGFAVSYTTSLNYYIVFNQMVGDAIQNQSNTLLFFRDFFTDPYINDGEYGVTPNYYYNQTNILSPSYNLNYSIGDSNYVNIIWNHQDPASGHARITGAHDLLAVNGIVHEVDKIFYPLQ